MIKIKAESNGNKIDAELYENETERKDMEFVSGYDVIKNIANTVSKILIKKKRGREMKTFSQIEQENIKYTEDGVDIVYIEEPEFSETINAIMDSISFGDLFDKQEPHEGSDTFGFRGVQYIRK